MMKILIYNSKYGNGHLHASSALENLLNEKNEVQMIDGMEQNFKVIDNIICKIYNDFMLVNAHRKTVRYTYDIIFNIFSSNLLYRLVKFPISMDNERLDYVENSDLIIQTYPFNSKEKLKIPFIILITDYGVHNLSINKNADHFFVASKYTKEKLKLKGIDDKKITITGIPIEGRFYQENSTITPKKVLLNFGAKGINLNKKYKNQIKSLLNTNLNLSIICGNNVELYNELKNDFSKNDNLTLYGYVLNMDEILKEHDILVTKPGGITLTEAIYAETPVIINKSLSILGQEKENLNYINFTKIGIVSDDKNLSLDVEKLLNNKGLYFEMVNNMKNEKVKKQQELITQKINEILLTKNNEY